MPESPSFLEKVAGSVTRVRHLDILRALRERPTALVKDLADQLDVSPSTIRRDLDELETQGLVQRVFGGVILQGRIQAEPAFETRETLNAREKDLIGRAAAGLVRDGEVVFIDGGTTTQFIVPYLAPRRDLSVITCGLNVANRLNSLKNVTAIVVGGEIHFESHSMIGPLALQALEIFNMRCDKAFISAAGISAEFGATNRMLDRIPLKRKGIEISKEAILVGDGSKVGHVTLGQIAPLTAFHWLITDASAPAAELEAIRAQGVLVTVV